MPRVGVVFSSCINFCTVGVDVFPMAVFPRWRRWGRRHVRCWFCQSGWTLWCGVGTQTAGCCSPPPWTHRECTGSSSGTERNTTNASLLSRTWSGRTCIHSWLLAFNAVFTRWKTTKLLLLSRNTDAREADLLPSNMRPPLTSRSRPAVQQSPYLGPACTNDFPTLSIFSKR